MESEFSDSMSFVDSSEDEITPSDTRNEVNRLKLTTKEQFDIQKWSRTLEGILKNANAYSDDVFDFRSALKERLPLAVPENLRKPRTWTLSDECGSMYLSLLEDLGRHLDAIDVRKLVRRCSGDCSCIVQRSPVGDRGGSVRNVLCAREELSMLGTMELGEIVEVSENLKLVVFDFVSLHEFRV
jgi:hypothetical protein